MLPFQVDLSDKVVAVTGGGGILCGEMAKALGACGAKVAVLDLRKENAEGVVNEITEAGGAAMAVACNVMEKESLEDALATIEAAWGFCNVLVNGAGGNHPKGTAGKEMVSSDDINETLEGSFFDMGKEGIEFVFDLNYLGTVLTSQVFGKAMAQKGEGCVVNISSMSAYHPLTKVMAYSNAKAAIVNYTEWLATHLAPTGVRVNAIAPGFFLTDQNRQLLMGDNNTPTPRCQKILDNTPMGRLGDPADLLGALLYLVNDKASAFVTGTVMAIDGGFNAYSGV